MRSMQLEQLTLCGLSMARIGMTATLSGRTILLGRALFYLFVLLILGTFWSGVAAEHATDAMKLPYGMVSYVGITEWIILSVPSLHLRLEDDIRSGVLEAHLLRPMPYLFGRISETIGGLTVRLGVLGGAGLVVLMFSRSGPPPAVWPLVILLALLGGIINILLIAIVGLSAFWLRRCLAVFLIMQKLTFLLGGLFAPLTLYPTWLARTAEASPFAASLYWPAVIVLQPDAATVLLALVAVLAWIVALSLLCGLIWRSGMRRLLTTGV